MSAEGMSFKIFLFLFFCSFPSILSQDNNDVTILVNGSAIEAEIDDSFVCATLDWWPPEKCNYNQCPWGNASILNLDLNHPYLFKAIQAFCPLRIRVGGSLEDQVVYGVGGLSPCDPFTHVSGGLFGFSNGCLSLGRWDELNFFFQNTGAIVTFGLNALYGRHQGGNGVWQGAWNSSNAREFMEYTVFKGYPVDSWEFGNELSGSGVSARVGAQQYGEDLVVLKAIIDELYNKSHPKPLIVAPGGFFDNQQWYVQLLEVSGVGVLDAMSHHVYNLGAGNDPHIISRIMDPKYLSRFEDTFRNVKLTIQRYGPWSAAWVGEAGGAYNSGSRLVSNTFLNSFWYLDQLGMASKYDTKVYCRQTLIGGNYGLLDLETFIPNPDYYSALLWHRLMGNRVLNIDINGSTYLRAYAHCRKHKSGVTILLINLCKSNGFAVAVRNSLDIDLEEATVLKQTVSWVGKTVSDGSETREEYHLTGQNGDYLSRIMLLNGNPLQLTEDGEIPDLNPFLTAINSPITIAPLSIAFVVFPNFEAEACAC